MRSRIYALIDVDETLIDTSGEYLNEALIDKQMEKMSAGIKQRQLLKLVPWIKRLGKMKKIAMQKVIKFTKVKCIV